MTVSDKELQEMESILRDAFATAKGIYQTNKGYMGFGGDYASKVAQAAAAMGASAQGLVAISTEQARRADKGQDFKALKTGLSK